MVNKFKADVNEITLCALLAEGKQFLNEGAALQKLSEATQKLPLETLVQQRLFAKGMFSSLSEWLREHSIQYESVEWFANDHSHVSDIVLHSPEGKFGISVKSLQGYATKSQFANPGMTAISQHFKQLDISERFAEWEASLVKKLKLPSTRKERKEWMLENREEFDKKVIPSSVSFLDDLSDEMLEEFDSFSNAKMKKFLNCFLSHNHIEWVQILKCSEGVKIHRPFDKVDSKNIKVQKTGNHYLTFVNKHGKVLSLRPKFESYPLTSSLKFSISE